MWNVPESINHQIDGLNEAYINACDRKDYVRCNVIRLELSRVLTGKKLLIPAGFNLGPVQDLTENMVS